MAIIGGGQVREKKDDRWVQRCGPTGQMWRGVEMMIEGMDHSRIIIHILAWYHDLLEQINTVHRFILDGFFD